jgi:hypothetical protein
MRDVDAGEFGVGIKVSRSTRSPWTEFVNAAPETVLATSCVRQDSNPCLDPADEHLWGRLNELCPEARAHLEVFFSLE